MRPFKKLLGLVFMSALLSIVVNGCSSGSPSGPLTIQEAQKNGDVRITVSGGTLDTMNLQVEYDGSEKCDYVIPIGTLFESSDQKTQNMITAHNVTISFPGGDTPQVQNISVEAFCINLFKTEPIENPSIPLFNNDLKIISNGTVEYGDDIFNLNKCLEQMPDSHQIKNLAIWMISDKLIDLSREDVASKLSQHYHDDDVQADYTEEAKTLAAKYPALYNNTPLDSLKEM